MRLTDYIIDLGRVVAYYPRLNRVTNSTNATLLLCQLLYWTDKTNDGWIWKDSNDIEEEIGLTKYEQKTAREILVESGLIEEEYKRLEHKIRFRVNQDELNTQWEETGGQKTKPIKKEVKKSAPKKSAPKEPVSEESESKKETSAEKRERLAKQLEQAKKEVEEQRENKKEPEGSWLELAVGSEKAKKTNEKIAKKKEIKEKIEKKLNITATDYRWGKFIDFVYTQETEHDKEIDIFLNWAIHEGFDPMYWTPEKCKTVYPRAFTEDSRNRLPKNFVRDLPNIEEKEYAPMPDNIKRKLDLGID